jgi:hypothetical protein
MVGATTRRGIKMRVAGIAPDAPDAFLPADIFIQARSESGRMPAVSPFGVLLFAAQVGVGAQVSRSLSTTDRARRAAVGLAVAVLGLLVLFRFGAIATFAVDLVALLLVASATGSSGRRPTAG